MIDKSGNHLITAKDIENALAKENSAYGWRSPINFWWDVKAKQIKNDFESEAESVVYEECVKVGATVDKDELFRLLNRDRNQYQEGYRNGYEAGIKAICEAADVEKVRHGHWVKGVYFDNNEEEHADLITCSHCNAVFTDNQYFFITQYYGDFCPECGAKMDERGEEDEQVH